MDDRTDALKTLADRRRTADQSQKAGSVTFRLEPAPPFRLDLTAWILRRRAQNAMDRWDGTTYRRVVRLDDAPVQVAVAQIGPSDSPHLDVSVFGTSGRSAAKTVVTGLLDRMLGLKIDLGEFYRTASRDARLAPLAERFRGMRPPRFPTAFEALVNGIACQQVSLTVGITLLNRLSQSYGALVGEKEAAAHAFPRPEDLAPLDLQALRPMGFSLHKSRAIVEAARAVLEGRIDLESLADLSDEEAAQRLQQLRGVGRWTAEYVLLRGLGRWRIFPGDDIGARNNLTRWLKLRKPLDYERVRRVLARWKGYGGLVYFHLLLDRLAAAQLVF